jgi:hypothetical protein
MKTKVKDYVPKSLKTLVHGEDFERIVGDFKEIFALNDRLDALGVKHRFVIPSKDDPLFKADPEGYVSYQTMCEARVGYRIDSIEGLEKTPLYVQESRTPRECRTDRVVIVMASKDGAAMAKANGWPVRRRITAAQAAEFIQRLLSGNKK